MIKKVLYGIGLYQIGYQAYSLKDYLYRYGFHENCQLKTIYPQSYALVTGASQGIGLGYADELARRGYNVIMVSRGKDKLQNAAEKLQQKYSNVKIESKEFNLETENTVAIGQFFEKLKLEYKDQIGIFVNNAAAFEKEYFPNLTPAMIKSVLDTNIIGTTLLMQQQLKYAAQNSSDTQAKTLLINIGSQKASREPAEEAIVYYSSKQYLNHLTQCLRQQYAKSDQNIHIINNSPGFTDTPMLSAFYPNFLDTFAGKFMDSPINVAKQTLDQIDLNPTVINGTEKQALGNFILPIKSALHKLIN